MIMKFFTKKLPWAIYCKLRNLKMSSGTFSILMSKEDNNICPLLGPEGQSSKEFTTMAKVTDNNYQSEWEFKLNEYSSTSTS